MTGMYQTMEEDEEEVVSNKLATTMMKARKSGALFHITNPSDAGFCTECSVFWRGDKTCWSCKSTDTVEMQWVPRFGGGSQSYNACEEVI